MQKMKSDIYKLHEESSKAEDDVKTTIQKIDTFLNKKELSTTGILQSKNNHLKSKSQLKVKYIIPQFSFKWCINIIMYELQNKIKF